MNGFRKARDVAIGFALAVVAAATVPGAAWAHGGLSMDKDMCKLRIGPYYMHFTGYQVRSGSPNNEFCEDIPATGNTIIVMDAIDQELRGLPLKVQIVNDAGDGKDGSTVIELPAKVYPSGTVPLEFDFQKPGRFVGLVTAGDKQQFVSRFPFSVAVPKPQYGFYSMIAVVVLLSSAMLWFSARRRAKAAQAQLA